MGVIRMLYDLIYCKCSIDKGFIMKKQYDNGTGYAKCLNCGRRKRFVVLQKEVQEKKK